MVSDVFVLFRGFCKIVKREYWFRHVCPFVRKHGITRLQLDGFLLNCSLNFLRKPVQKIQVALKCTLYEDVFTFITISRWILLRKRNISDKICRENENTYFMHKSYFRKSCGLWDNVEKYGGARETTDDNIIWRNRFAYCESKAIIAHAHAYTQWHTRTNPRAHTNTQPEISLYNSYRFSTAKIFPRTRLNITSYVHCFSCF